MTYIYETIGNLCTKITDGSHFSPVERDEGFPMYSSKDMLYDCFDDSSVKRIGKEDFDKLVNQDCKPQIDDVLIIKDGNSYLKRVFRIKEDIEAVILSSIAILRPNKNIIDPQYFTYVLRTASVYNAMANYVSGAAIPRVVLRDFKKMKLRIHKDLYKQKQVATILSAYDSQIENNQKRIKLLEQMAENLYKEWFVRFRYPGYETAEFEGGVPKGWKIKKLKEFITFYRGKSYSSADIASGDYVLLSMNNIRPWGGYIRDDSRVFGGVFKDYQLIHKGDLIMSITDMTQDRRIIGYVGIMDEERNDCVISTHLMKVVSKYNNYFLYGMFNFSLSRSVSEYATGANVLGLTDKILKEIKAIVPSDELICKYGKQVAPIWETIFHLKDEIANLTTQRDLLLPRLMSGKINI